MIDSVERITSQTISLIEKELQPIDVTSLIFLLNDDHREAFVEVAVLERKGACNSPLSTWAQAQQGDYWRHKFIEALNICQLQFVLRNLGLNHSGDQATRVGKYIDPIKVCLYRICENIETMKFQLLKDILMSSHLIPVFEYKSCELIILKLLCEGLIVIQKDSCNIELLLKVLCSMDLRNLALELLDLQNKYPFIPAASSAVDKYNSVENVNGYDGEDVLMSVDEDKSDKRLNVEDLNDNSPSDDLQKIADLYSYGVLVNDGSDSQVGHLNYIHNMYPIKGPERLGIALIINLERCHVGNGDVRVKDCDDCLAGSLLIANTMRQQKFQVMHISRINWLTMLDSIKFVIKKCVDVKNDSIFSVFVLFHGGHAVRIEDIKKTIFDELKQIGLTDIAKLLMIHACELRNDVSENSLSKEFQKLVKDGVFGNVGSDSQVGHPIYIHNNLKPLEDVYPIKDPERLGIALIINLETFHIENGNVPVKDRNGCLADTKLISDTMNQLKFKVMAIPNTNYLNMLDGIKYVIKEFVDEKNDSIFSVFILSHGGHGYVISSDCLAVRIEDIKKTICDELNNKGLPDIPKLLMINACQVSDGVLKNFSKTRVTDFITCYSTTPGLESYRLPAHAREQGAIYPKVFCSTLLEYKDSLDMLHIHNKINKKMKDLFKNIKDKDKQMSYCENTTPKNLYFKRFKNNTPM